MYNPVKDGMDKTTRGVEYTETTPPNEIRELVVCFWELKTTSTLEEDFHLHAIPDACVDIMFNEINTDIAGVTGLKVKYEVLNLGKVFHYVGIQFSPGVWRAPRDQIADHYIGEPYSGELPFIETNNKMVGANFHQKQLIMTELVRQLQSEKIIEENLLTSKIVAHIDDIHTVADMSDIVDISPRQLQRILKKSTGLSPHDFLKILRLQQSFTYDYNTHYADQSHFIRSFRSITGYTPSQYFSKFDV
ncbi:AraC family transcriptional regulator [bacterium]|nr:MAG: AraC family transcriptional regulator [bacterium]